MNLFGHVTKSYVVPEGFLKDLISTNQVYIQVNFLTLLFISYIFYV